MISIKVLEFVNYKMSLAKIDMIGNRPGFFVDKSSIHKSSIGGILTILTSLLSVLCFIGFGIDLFERKRPEIYNSKELNFMNKIEKKHTIFALAPMMRGGYNIPDLERKFLPFFSHAQVNSSLTDNPTVFNNFALVKCQDTKLFKDNVLNITKMLIGQMDTYYCLPDDFDTPMIGKFGNPFFSLYEFYLK